MTLVTSNGRSAWILQLVSLTPGQDTDATFPSASVVGGAATGGGGAATGGGGAATGGGGVRCFPLLLPHPHTQPGSPWRAEGTEGLAEPASSSLPRKQSRQEPIPALRIPPLSVWVLRAPLPPPPAWGPSPARSGRSCGPALTGPCLRPGGSRGGVETVTPWYEGGTGSWGGWGGGKLPGGRGCWPGQGQGRVARCLPASRRKFRKDLRAGV